MLARLPGWGGGVGGTCPNFGWAVPTPRHNRGSFSAFSNWKLGVFSTLHYQKGVLSVTLFENTRRKLREFWKRESFSCPKAQKREFQYNPLNYSLYRLFKTGVSLSWYMYNIIIDKYSLSLCKLICRNHKLNAIPYPECLCFVLEDEFHFPFSCSKYILIYVRNIY